MTKAKVLIFTTCYNESENIGRMIDQIIGSVPDADVLVVDDNSPDGTWEIIEEKKTRYNNLYSIKRPRKLGIGSAHKYAIYYAMREGYETLVTLDADFSHDPQQIPSMLRLHGKNTFVTGSRYCEGGTSDHTGYRMVVSRLGNVVARKVLGIRLKELTTYFRVFDVDSLRRLPLRYINSAGYSYGVELVYYLRKCGVELREYPIHFMDRTLGRSKIPRMQIVKSAYDLLALGLRRLSVLRELTPDILVSDRCLNCGDAVLAMKHFGSRKLDGQLQSPLDEDQLKCTAVGSADYPPVYVCLCCNLEQVPASMIRADLEAGYQDVVDETYIENIPAREKTFSRSFEQISPFIPGQPGHLLEIGSYCGLFLKEAKRRGWDGEGIEPSRWAANYASENSRVKVFQGFLEGNRENLRPQYDVVVSWDVLEHVRDPKVFIQTCGEYLAPGGTLCVSTLDIDTWVPRLLKTRWPWLMNMHICYFDRSTLADLLKRSGFTLIHSDSYVHYARAQYVFTRGLRVLPRFIRLPLSIVGKLIPDGVTLPISFGDIKLYVAIKTPIDRD